MKRKGFTLIELLAVIVLLAVVALIATPAVLNIIEDSRRSAVEESGRNITRAAETYYMQGVMKGEVPDDIDLSENTLNYTGETPEKGTVIYDDTGRVYLKMYQNGYCVTVDYDNTVKSEKVDKSECLINPVILSINANGGEVSEVSREYNSGDILGSLPTPSKEGYTFQNWINTDGEVITNETKITEATTITAKWQANKYKVTIYDGSIESIVKVIEVTYDSTYGELPTLEKDTHIFTGYKTSGGENITSETIVKLASDHALYAQWKEKQKFTIDFTNNNEDNYGGIDPNNISFTYKGVKYTNSKIEVYEGDEVTFNITNSSQLMIRLFDEGRTKHEVLANNPGSATATYVIKNNLVFTLGAAQVFITLDLIEGNKTIVTLNADGGIIPEGEEWNGTGSIVTKEIISGGPYGKLPEPTKEGYTFLGWYKSNDVKVLNKSSFVSSDNNTLTAKWEAKEQYTVDFTNNNQTEYVHFVYNGQKYINEKITIYDGDTVTFWLCYPGNKRIEYIKYNEELDESEAIHEQETVSDNCAYVDYVINENIAFMGAGLMQGHCVFRFTTVR